VRSEVPLAQSLNAGSLHDARGHRRDSRPCGKNPLMIRRYRAIHRGAAVALNLVPSGAITH
jgi:hypothetical protein